jgi:hypothetical protein
MGADRTITVKLNVSKLGRAGGAATARNRTAEQRQAAARKAAAGRWEKYYKEHPEKRKKPK